MGAGSVPISLCLAGGVTGAMLRPPAASVNSRWGMTSPWSHLPAQLLGKGCGSRLRQQLSQPCPCCLGAPKPKCCERAKLNSAQLSLCFSKDKLKGRRNVFSFAFVISLSGRYFFAQFAGEWELPAEPSWLQSRCWARHKAFLF